MNRLLSELIAYEMFAQTIVRATGMRELCKIPKSLLWGDSVFVLLFDDKGSCHLGAKLEFLPKTQKTQTE